jgi:hypothetical protein
LVTLSTRDSRQCLRLAGALLLSALLLRALALRRFTLRALALAALLRALLLRRLALRRLALGRLTLRALALGRLASALGRSLATLVLSALLLTSRTTLAVLHCRLHRRKGTVYVTVGLAPSFQLTYPGRGFGALLLSRRFALRRLALGAHTLRRTDFSSNHCI